MVKLVVLIWLLAIGLILITFNTGHSSHSYYGMYEYQMESWYDKVGLTHKYRKEM